MNSSDELSTSFPALSFHEKPNNLAVFVGDVPSKVKENVLKTSDMMNPKDKWDLAFGSGTTHINFKDDYHAKVFHTDEDLDALRFRWECEGTKKNQIGELLNYAKQQKGKQAIADRLKAKLAKKKGYDISPEAYKTTFHHRDQDYQVVSEPNGALMVTLFKKMPYAKERAFYEWLAPMMDDHQNSPEDIVTHIRAYLSTH